MLSQPNGSSMSTVTYSPPVINAFFLFSLPAALYSSNVPSPSRAVDSLVGFSSFSCLYRPVSLQLVWEPLNLRCTNPGRSCDCSILMGLKVPFSPALDSLDADIVALYDRMKERCCGNCCLKTVRMCRDGIDPRVLRELILVGGRLGMWPEKSVRLHAESSTPVASFTPL